MDIEGTVTTLVLAAFVGTQGMYLIGALVIDWLLVFGARSTVETPADDRSEPMTVLVTLYQEPRSVVVETLSSLADQAYDLSAVRVVLVYEADDTVVTEYVDGIVAADTEPWDLRTFAVERGNQALLDRMTVDWPMDQTETIPRTKAFALASAYYSLDFGDDEIVTVFDADTLVAPDLFALAVAGLEEYDIVQAKQTVRNIDDGIIPKLEAMGMAAWSGVVYPRTAKGPYQLLGKGYFLRGRTLKRTRGWQPDEVTEDMAFGVTAYKRGLTLGVLDSYVQDLCPAGIGPWVRQKRRWLGGPYRALGNQPLSRFDQARLVGVTMVNQAVSLTTLLGLPAGIVVSVLVANSGPLSFPLWFTAVLLVNLLNWVAYSLLGYRETFAALAFDSRWQKAEFFLVSNPLTQSVYACLWSVPLLLAARDHVSGAPSVFEVTPKHVDEQQ